MNRRSLFTLTIMAPLGLAVILPTGDAAAQQKQRVTFKVSAENAKYADSGPSRTVIPTHCGQRSGDCGQLLMSV